MSRILGFGLIALCGALLVFSNSSERPLLKSSEGRVARVAQEMLEDGDWIVPHLNGEVRLEKPPLSSWLVALTALASGKRSVEPWHAHLPPGLATIALLLLVFGWLSAEPTHQPLERYAGLLAAFFLALAPGFIMQARSAEGDMLLALWVALVFYGAWRHRAHHSRVGLLLAYVGIALSILTKGHVGLVIAVPALLLWNLWENSHQALRRAPSGAWRWHLLGMLLVAAIVLPWGIPFLQQSGFSLDVLNREGGLARFDRDKTGHNEPFYWYLFQIPGWFMPWFILLPVALWQTRKSVPDHWSPLRRLCWAWFGWGLLLFSLLASKQRHYAIPFFAPLSILIADAFIRWGAKEQRPYAAPCSLAAQQGANQTAGLLLGTRSAAHRLASALSLLLALACALVPLVMSRTSPIAPIVKQLAGEQLFVVDDQMLNLVWAVGLSAAAAFLAGSVLLNSRRNWLPAWWLGGALAVVLFGATLEHQEAIDQLDLQRFTLRVNRIVPMAVPLYDYNVVRANKVWRAQVLFYLGRKVTRSEQPLPELLAEAARKGEPVFVLVNDKILNDVPEGQYQRLTSAPQFLGHRNDVFLIRSRGDGK